MSAALPAIWHRVSLLFRRAAIHNGYGARAWTVEFRSLAMGQVNAPLLALNRGEVSRQALARVDVDRLRLAAETQVNCVPTVLGSMSLRPGLAMIGRIVNDDRTKLLPFVRGFDETALIEVTRSYVRVWIDDAIVRRNSTGTQLQNSTFAAGAGWSTAGTTGG
jgi:hypothetical protein